MKTIKYVLLSLVLTGLIYIVFASEADSIDIRTWKQSAQFLFVLASFTVDLILIELYRVQTKTQTE